MGRAPPTCGSSPRARFRLCRRRSGFVEDGLLLVDLEVAASGILVSLRRNGDELEGRFTDWWAAFTAMRPRRICRTDASCSGSDQRTRATVAPPNPWELNRVVWFPAHLTGLPSGVGSGCAWIPGAAAGGRDDQRARRVAGPPWCSPRRLRRTGRSPTADRLRCGPRSRKPAEGARRAGRTGRGSGWRLRVVRSGCGSTIRGERWWTFGAGHCSRMLFAGQQCHPMVWRSGRGQACELVFE